VRRFKVNIAIQLAIRSVAIDVREGKVAVSCLHSELDIQKDTSDGQCSLSISSALGNRLRRCYPRNGTTRVAYGLPGQVPSPQTPHVKVGNHRGQ
jgi:hypothetical protein